MAAYILVSNQGGYSLLLLQLLLLVLSPSSSWTCQAFQESAIIGQRSPHQIQGMDRNAAAATKDTFSYFHPNQSSRNAVTVRRQVVMDPRHDEAASRPRRRPGGSPPPSSSSSSSSSSSPAHGGGRHRKSNYLLPKKRKFSKTTPEDVWKSGRWERAIRVESMLLSAVDALQQSIAITNSRQPPVSKMEGIVETTQGPPVQPAYVPLAFPGIRDCNAALASFGDGHDLLRALRLFGKMRKASALSQRYCQHHHHQQQPSRGGILPPIPSPTLVTYSTIMSRAIHLGKPLVALRLWNLMRQQRGFFYTAKTTTSSSVSSSSSSSMMMMKIIPDVKAANILMNCYAKLGDVTSARDLLNQMLNENGGPDVPRMHPNIVTYNTLLDACHKRGELDVAMNIKEQMELAGWRPDARTYTTLIATVARKASSVSGAHDPTPAFELYQEMKLRHVRPNGMTYSALIDVCSRCRRSDFALKVLRSMLDQKAQDRKELDLGPDAKYTLSSEVGAWTAAINACGKSGRLDSAIRLFYAMPKFGVYPNTVTCGCLTDSLLKHRRTAETLEVLRYMKRHNIVPSAVMYTSLMISAGRLVQFENKKQNDFRKLDTTSHLMGGNPAAKDEKNAIPVDESGETKAIEVYTELIMSLMMQGERGPRHRSGPSRPALPIEKEKGDSTEMFKVFLVFQEMKAAGARPDLACYNALLKTCAIAGDIQRAEDVLEQLLAEEELAPNDTSFRDTIRAAGKAKRSDSALATWKTALAYRGPDKQEWTPSVESLSALVQTLVASASDDDDIDPFTRRGLYHKVLNLYTGVMASSSSSSGYSLAVEHRMGMDRVDQEKMVRNPFIMLLFLQAAVAIGSDNEVTNPDNCGFVGRPSRQRKRQHRDRSLAISVFQSPCFQGGLPPKYQRNAIFSEAYRIAETWAKEEMMNK